MKKNWLLLCTTMALILILSACGTSDTGQDKPEESNGNGTEAPADEVDGAEDDGPEENNGTEEPDDEEDVVGETPEKDNDNDNGTTEPDNSFFDKATQVNSDTQDYSVYLLPEYQLTGEEPGKDSLYLAADDSVFMRIETMSSEDVTVDYLTENTVTFLEAASNGKTPDELTDAKDLPAGDDLKSVKGYTVDVEEGTVTGIVFERDNLLVRLSIFDSAEGAHFEDFLKMGETIAKNE